MIVSTDQQAFSVTIMVNGSDGPMDTASPPPTREGPDEPQYGMGGSHEAGLLTGLARLRERGLLLDVQLWAEGQLFQAHRVVLAGSSDYFQAMFTAGLRETVWEGEGECQTISLPGITAQGLGALLDYVYTARLNINHNNIQEVLAAAAQLQVPAVVEAAAEFLEKHLELENCVDVVTLAETFSLSRLRRSTYRFMSANLRQFTETPEFQNLAPSQMVHLLHADFPVNLKESEVLSAAASWVEFDSPSRCGWVEKIVGGVRLDEVPGEELAALLDRPGLAGVRKRLAALERLSPTRVSGTHQMVNYRGMEMAVVKVGGFSSGTGITNDISFYHAGDGGAWRQLTSIPHVECCNFGVAVLHNELYVVGGCFNQELQENVHPFGFKYSPQADKWKSIAAMGRERCRFSLTECSGRLYAVGGAGDVQSSQDDPSVEVYDPSTDRWKPTASLPGGNRSQHAAVRWMDTVVVSGGLDQDTVLDTVLQYTPNTGTWKELTELPVARADHSMVVHDSGVFVVGGWSGLGVVGRRPVAEVDRLDAVTNSWTVETVIPTPRFHAGVSLIKNKIYIVGGFLSDNIFDKATGIIECYDLESKSWSQEKTYPLDIWEHSVVGLQVPRCREGAKIEPNFA